MVLSGNYLFGAHESLIYDELRNGLLLPVLPDWYAFEIDFYIVSKRIYHVRGSYLLTLYMSACAILQLVSPWIHLITNAKS